MYLELAFDVFECGPGRLAEVRRIEMVDLKFKLGTYSYYLIVLKQTSVTSNGTQKEKHVQYARECLSSVC